MGEGCYFIFGGQGDLSRSERMRLTYFRGRLLQRQRHCVEACLACLKSNKETILAGTW